MDPTILASVATRALVDSFTGSTGELMSRLAALVAERLRQDPESAAAVEDIQQHPNDPETERRLRNTLVDVVIMDHSFAGNVRRIVGESARQDTAATITTEMNASAPADTGETPDSSGASPAGDSAATAAAAPAPASSPVRGIPGLTVAASSPQTTAGSDFSIFVLVQNPFDVPVTVHNVQTHIPVELIDINQYRLKLSRRDGWDSQDAGRDADATAATPWRLFRRRRSFRQEHSGVAVAVGTEFSPETVRELFRNEVHINRDLHIQQGGSATFSAVSFFLPPGASSDELDGLMRRAVNYQKGVMPIRLQPGDSVVRQFVLRTRSKLLFRPLVHTFQIQVNYSVDGVDHTGTTPFQLTIQAALESISWGSVAGAFLGGTLKSLTRANQPPLGGEWLVGALQGVSVAVLASIAVIIAFARKSSAQPIVSVEDFWGGFVIGFSVGFFGFDRFLGLFPSAQAGT